MTTEAINKIFEIHIEEFESWEKRPRKNNFFEIVYVEKGSGMQCICKPRLPNTHPNLRYIITPSIVNTLGVNTPKKVPNFMG